MIKFFTLNQLWGLGRAAIWFAAGCSLGLWLGSSIDIIWKFISALNDLTQNTTGLLTLIFGGIGTWRTVKANSKPSIIAAATKLPEVDSDKLQEAISDPTLKEVAAAPANSPNGK